METRPAPKSDISWGYWVVAFLDLQGLGDALMKADFLPDPSDADGVARLRLAIRDSVGAIQRLHSHLNQYQSGRDEAANDPHHLAGLTPEQKAFVFRTNAYKSLEIRWSDGVVLAARLGPEDDHNPVIALWNMLLTSAAAAIHQIGIGEPIRGGIAIGMGCELNEQIVGPALVKAYRLERKDAKWPRVLVDPEVITYLTACTQVPPATDIKTASQADVARRLLGIMCKGEDDRPMLDFAGKEMASLAPSIRQTVLFDQGLTFAKQSRERFKAENAELFERYSKLVRYLEPRKQFW